MPHQAKPSGALSTSVVKPLVRPAVRTVEDVQRYGGEMLFSGRSTDAKAWLERPDVQWRRDNQVNMRRSMVTQDWAVRASRRGALVGLGHLWLAKVTRKGVLDLGLAGCQMVTTAGVNYIVDAFQNLVELENLKYHGLGTSSAVEAVSNTGLGSEFTTQYATNNTRATGTTGEQSGNPNVYETTALVTVDAAVTAVEHGIFSRAQAPGGVLFDRTVFTGVPLASGESLQCTYQFTLIAGG